MYYCFTFLGSFHQYDSTIFPEKDPRLFSRWRSEGMLSHSKTQQKCLPLFLKKYKDVLLACDAKDMTFYDNIVHVFDLMTYPVVYHHNQSYVWHTNGVPEVKLLYMCFVHLYYITLHYVGF